MTNAYFADLAITVPYFNGREQILDAVNVYSEVSDCIIIVDNGSNQDSKNTLMKLRNREGVTIISNKDNKGIAHALNQGLALAKTKHKAFLLTVDQDTILDKRCIIRLHESISPETGIVSVGPEYILNKKVTENKEVRYLITSGNLVSIDALIAVGGYNDCLFIDGVDIELSFRLINNGYKLMMVHDAVMQHEIGVQEKSRLLGIPYQSHNPLRFYYLNRNNILIYYKYYKTLPKDCLKLCASQIIALLRVLIIEQNKIEKLHAIALGVVDGLRAAKIL